MSDRPEPGDAERQAILEAAVAELAARNVSAFTLDGVAARAGVDVVTVKQIWANTPELFAATLKTFARRNIAVPDSGSLRGDLIAYAQSLAGIVNAPLGRRVLDSLLVRARDWELTGSRSRYLESREYLGWIIERGIERGECPADVDAFRVMDLLGLGVCIPVLYYDRPITDEHCAFVVDTILGGIARAG